jgi:hypothetical protein
MVPLFEPMVCFSWNRGAAGSTGVAACVYLRILHPPHGESEFVAGGYDLIEALRVDDEGRLYFSELFRDGGVFRAQSRRPHRADRRRGQSGQREEAAAWCSISPGWR